MPMEITEKLESLLTADEVAAILKISKSFAYRLMQQGDVKTVRIRSSRRVRPEDLHGYIMANIRVPD